MYTLRITNTKNAMSFDTHYSTLDASVDAMKFAKKVLEQQLMKELTLIERSIVLLAEEVMHEHYEEVNFDITQKED